MIAGIDTSRRATVARRSMVDATVRVCHPMVEACDFSAPARQLFQRDSESTLHMANAGHSHAHREQALPQNIP